MTAHAKLGPSAAKRWMACPGSTRLLEGIPDPGSEPAAMGTYCHDQLARLLRGQMTTVAPTAVACEGWSFTYTEEMQGWVKRAARWVKVYMELHPRARLMVEQHSPVGHAFGHPDLLWGTSDIVIVNDEEHELVVADAKFGFEEVECEGNEQVSLYAIGMLHQLGWEHFDSVELAILQPRSPEPEKTEVLTIGEMRDRERSYKEPVERAVRWATADLVPADEACRWCRAAARCPALRAEAAIATDDAFARPELLPPEEVAWALERAGVIRKHLAAVETWVEQQLQLGQEIPGWKLVKSNRHRQWTGSPEETIADLQLVADVTRDELMEAPELKSPAQVEKLLKLKLPDSVAAKPEGEPTLARDSDPREAIAPELDTAYLEGVTETK